MHPHPSTLAWVALAVIGGAIAGVEWLLQPIEVPLVGVLILTFVPVTELVTFLRGWLRRFNPDP